MENSESLDNKKELNFRLLQVDGDPLEKHIVGHGPLIAIMYTYADIWATHIFPRRLPDNKAHVEFEWLPFASAHYTAIIRTYQVCMTWERIDNLCHSIIDAPSPGNLLDFHELSSSFWEHMGSAIDTLGKCFDSPFRLASGEGLDLLKEKSEDLAFIFKRRNQFIHDRLVPAAVKDGVLQFNEVLFADKRTNWNVQQQRLEDVHSFYDDYFRRFLKGIYQGWLILQCHVREKDKVRPQYDLTKVINEAENRPDQQLESSVYFAPYPSKSSGTI